MVSISSLDTTSSAAFAICKLDSGRTVKFPKTKPSGASDANDAAWQTRMQTEVTNALNQTMNGSQKNATHHLVGLV